MKKKYQDRLGGWAKQLSPMGRVTLAKHVLNSILIHYISATYVPKSVLSKLNSITASFIWNDSGECHHHQWNSFSNNCYPLDREDWELEVYMNLRPIIDCRWFMQNSSLWASYFSVRYLKRKHRRTAGIRSGDSKFLNSLFKWSLKPSRAPNLLLVQVSLLSFGWIIGGTLPLFSLKLLWSYFVLS